MEEEGGTGDCLDAHLVIIALLRQPVSKKARNLASQRLYAGEGTDQHQRTRIRLLHQLESHSCADGPAHNYDVLLLEAQSIDDVVVDIQAVLLDGFAGGTSLVNAITAILHG